MLSIVSEITRLEIHTPANQLNLTNEQRERLFSKAVTRGRVSDKENEVAVNLTDNL